MSKLTVEQAEQIYTLSQAPGISTLIDIQKIRERFVNDSIDKFKLLCDKDQSHPGGKSFLDGMKMVSFISILKEAKEVIKKNSNTYDPR